MGWRGGGCRTTGSTQRAVGILAEGKTKDVSESYTFLAQYKNFLFLLPMILKPGVEISFVFPEGQQERHSPGELVQLSEVNGNSPV